jgi:hypothetical protein
MPPITNNLDNNEIALDREVLVPCGQPPHIGLACFVRQTPQATTRSKTCPGSSCGRGTSST